MKGIKLNEIWKDVAGWEGYYQVSNLGNIRSRDRWVENRGTSRFLAGKPMVPVKSTDGYLMVKFTRNNKATTHRIHRLVAEAFIENPEGLPEVNHLDCDRKNNIVTNLEWSTHADNVGHSRDKGHYKHYGADNQNYGHHTLHEYYSANPDMAIEKLSRPGSQNGHARKVILYDMENNEVSRFDWIGGCIAYLKENGFTLHSEHTVRAKLTHALAHGESVYDHYYKFA